jgi:hypothetical protein
MKLGIKSALCAVLATGAIVASASAASAAIVCNLEGDCWHAARPMVYRGRPDVVVHPDNWRWRAGEHYVFREHTGRGFWRHGVWVVF